MWEQLSRDTIDVKRAYIDVAEDLVAGILLSQIIYWNLPSQNGKTKLRVKKDGELWLAKTREDWWDECRITPRQCDRALKILVDKKLVEKEIFKFNGNPTTHIKLNFDVLTQCLSVITQTGITKSPKGEEPNNPKGKNEIDQMEISLTETTTKTTTKINNNNSGTTIVEAKNEISATKEKTDDVVDDFLANELKGTVGKVTDDAVDDFLVKELKSTIEEVTGDVVVKGLLYKFLETQHDSEQRIRKAVQNYPAISRSILKSREVINPVGLFFHIAENNLEPPRSKAASRQINKKLDFDFYPQHEYTAEELEGLIEPIS